MNRVTKSVASVMLAVSALTFFSCDDDSTNVIGLNDAAQYGRITVKLEGKRPDGVDFTKKIEFRFMPEEGPQYSSISYDGNAYFFVQRHHGAVNESHNDNYAGFNLQADVDTQTPVTGSFYMYTSVIDEDDNVYFYLNDEFTVDMADVTNFNYSEGTGKLKYSFTTQLDANSNSTGNDLTVTVEANVNVFEGLNGNFGGNL